MKVFKSLSFLLGTLILLFIPEPSYGKETWLKCEEKPVGWTKEDINIIKLDSKNEKFEIKGWATNRIVSLGKANYFTDTIQLKFSNQSEAGEKLIFDTIFEIDRASLTYSYSVTTLTAARTPISISGYISKGICKIIPAPSSKKNLI